MSSSSFWSQVRWRLGGSGSLLNRISDLIQKQIDANSDAQDVTIEEILNPIVTIPSKVMMRDNLFKVALRNITVGQINYLPLDPDLDLMRLWITNDHGGRYLTDRSFMSNTIQLNGTDQTKIVSANDDEGIAGSPTVNRLIDDQYIRVLDNANVRIKEIAATAEGITVFLRLYIESSLNEGTFGKPGVLFSKLDTEQSDYAYAAYLEDDGGLQFIVRNAQKEYSLGAPAGSVTWTNLNLPDYSSIDYHPANYYTVVTIPELPDPAPYTDLAFSFKFSDKRMQIIKNGTLLMDSGAASDPRSTGVQGWWRLDEGGDIGNTPTPPVSSYTRTAFNSSSAAGATNGTISNATWSVSTTTPQHTFLSFDGSNDFVTIPNYTGISTITAFTISFWYYHRTLPNVDNRLIYKGTVAAANSFLVYAQSSGFVRLSIWNNSATRYDATSSTSAFAPGVNRWYHIAAKWTMGQAGKIFVDNVKVTGATTTGTLSTGSTDMIIGGGVNLAPNGYIHDVLVWDRELSDAEVTSMYNMGHPSAAFPPWQPDPPTEPPAPSPITNPFVSVYDVPLPVTAEQDSTRLHKSSVTSLTERYNVGQGAQGGNIAIGEDNQYYDNDPTYDSGGSAEVLSQYNTMTTPGGCLTLDHTKFGGERVETGIDIIGKVVTKVVAKVADIGGLAATGNIVAKIVDAGGTTRSTSTTVDAASIANNSSGSSSSGTAWTSSTFTFSGNSYSMANNDRIQFEYNQGGSGGTGNTLVYNVPWDGNSGSTALLNPNDYYGARETISSSSAPFFGKIVREIRVTLVRNNVPAKSTSQLSVGIRVNGVTTTFGTINTSSIPVDPNTQTFTFTSSTNTLVMSTNDSIFIQLTGDYFDNQMVLALANLSNPVAGCNIVRYGFPGEAQWSSADLAGQISVAGSVMQVGVSRSTSNPVSNARMYDAPWSTGSITTYSTSDLSMQVHVTLSGTPNHLYHPLYLTSGTPYAAIYINATTAGLFGQRITKCTFRLSKVGTPTGTLFCKIKKGSDGSTITFGKDGNPGTGLDVSTLITTANPSTPYVFQNLDNGQTTGYPLAVGDRVMLELIGGSSTSSSYVQVARTHTISTIPDVHMQLSTTGSSWTTPNSGVDDVIGKVAIGGHTTPISFPYHTLGYQNQRVLQKVTSTTASLGNIYNQKITQIGVWLKRVGSPTGLINAVIRNGSGTVVSTLNTFEAANVDDADFELIPFPNLSQSHTLVLNDRISIEYTGGDVSNHIQINTNLLDTYPYGVLETYSGTTFTTQSGHDVAGVMYSGGGSTDPLARPRIGEKVATTNSAIKLKTVSRIKVRMKKTSVPPGNVTFRIRNSADTVVQELGTLVAGDISGTFTEYTITSSPIALYALQVGDIVSVEYNNGDEANFVEVMTTKTTDGFDGTTDTYLVKYNDVSWVSNNAIDLVGQMWEGGETFTPSQEDVILPSALYTKDLTILAGSAPWTYIDHTTSTFTHAPSQLHVNAVMPDFRFYRKVLTTSELLNIFTNRSDRGAIAFGQVTKINFFSTTET